jgi:hypothetical protein
MRLLAKLLARLFLRGTPPAPAPGELVPPGLGEVTVRAGRRCVVIGLPASPALFLPEHARLIASEIWAAADRAEIVLDAPRPAKIRIAE